MKIAKSTADLQELRLAPRVASRPHRVWDPRFIQKTGALRSGLVVALLVAVACSDDGRTGPGTDPGEPAAVVVHAGDGQAGFAGNALARFPLVRVATGGGAGVAGVSVVFEVVEGGGSVEFVRAATTPSGIATPGAWTLGAPGPQRLRATVDGVGSAEFTATATAAPAEVVFVAGQGQSVPVGGAVPVQPAVMVSDSAGRGVPGARVVFAALGDAVAEGDEQVTDAQGRATVGSWTLGTKSGVYFLLATVPGTRLEDRPARLEAQALPGPATAVSMVAGDGQEAEASIPVAVPPRVQIADAYGNGVPDVPVVFRVTGGGGTVQGAETVTSPAGFAAPERWTLGPEPDAANTLVAVVTGGPLSGVSATFTAMATPPVYDIVVHHMSNSLVTDAQRAVFRQAEATWERAVGGNLRPVEMSKHDLEPCAEKVEGDLAVDVPGNRVVDDLLVFANVYAIDGRGGILGLAGPCFIRGESSLPIAGLMAFDIADMAALEERGHLEGTILHEMAHVLGFGAVWERQGLLAEPARGVGDEDTHFTGPAAVAAFDSVGGGAYVDGAKVPVENLGGEGTWNGHWRESVFRHELMTGFIDGGVHNPLSLVTIAALEDMGYEQVDRSVAEEYRLPLQPSPAQPGGPPPGTRLVGDILRIPVGVVDANGAVVEYLPPRR